MCRAKLIYLTNIFKQVEPIQTSRAFKYWTCLIYRTSLKFELELDFIIKRVKSTTSCSFICSLIIKPLRGARPFLEGHSPEKFVPGQSRASWPWVLFKLMTQIESTHINLNKQWVGILNSCDLVIIENMISSVGDAGRLSVIFLLLCPRRDWDQVMA